MYVILQGFSCTGKVPKIAVPLEDVKVTVPEDL